MVVGAPVAHHANAPDGQEYGEGLPDLIVKARFADLLDEDLVDVSKDVEMGLRDLADHPHRQARARERMALQETLGHAELEAELADLVLEELSQWLDQLEGEPLG